MRLYIVLRQKLFATFLLKDRFVETVQWLSFFIFSYFLCKCKRTFLHFLFFGFFKPSAVAAQASVEEPYPLLFFQRRKHFHGLSAKVTKGYSSIRRQLAAYRQLQGKLLRLELSFENSSKFFSAEAVNQVLQRGRKRLLLLKSSLQQGYKELCYYALTAVQNAYFFNKLLRLGSLGTKLLFFNGLYKSFRINGLAFFSETCFSPAIFAAYDFLLCNQPMVVSGLGRNCPENLSFFRSYFFWDLKKVLHPCRAATRSWKGGALPRAAKELAL